LARAPAVVARRRIARRLIAVAALAAAGAVALVLVVRSPSPPRVGRPLLVGVDDDSLKWTSNPLGVVRRQRALGAEAVRVWVPWAGETHPRGARVDELARAEQAARRTAVVLAIFGFARHTPATPAQQRRFCTFARRALGRVPHARAVVVWNEANAPAYWRGTPAQYEALLARCYDTLHRAGLTILDSTAAAHAPEAFLRAVGRAYRASGRTRPLVDAFGHNPYPRTPAEPPEISHAPGYLGQGDYARLVATLDTAFGHVPGIWYLEDGYQSHVPPRLRHRYEGDENVAAVAPRVQARHLADAIRLAACQEHVQAFFNFELVDETRLAGWQSGLLWRGVHRKPAASAFADAARRAAAGCY